MTNCRSGMIQRTIQCMNHCVISCNEPNFNAHEISRMFKTSNSLFYNAVELGYFARIGRSDYQFMYDKFTYSMAVKLVEFTAKKQKISMRLSRAKSNVINITKEEDAPLVFPLPEPYNVFGFPPHVLIAELKRVGFTGTLNNKTEL